MALEIPGLEEIENRIVELYNESELATFEGGRIGIADIIRPRGLPDAPHRLRDREFVVAMQNPYQPATPRIELPTGRSGG